MLWLDRSGKELETVGAQGENQDPQFSPAGDQLAFDLLDERSGKADIWIRDLARGVNSRFTFGQGNAYCPVWTPRGDAIVYASDREGAAGLYEKSMVGQGEEKLLIKYEGLIIPASLTPDGSALLYNVRDPKTGWNIMILPRTDLAKPVPFRATPFNESNAEISPDGKFISYNSNESGRNEVYVQSYPGPGRTWQISTAGGTDAHWRQDGKELYYRSLDQKLMAVDVQTGETFQAGIPRALFQAQVATGAAVTKYRPDRSGQKFLFVAPMGRDALSPTTVVLNWFAALGK
jgi:Tol biopolymer transport system component